MRAKSNGKEKKKEVEEKREKTIIYFPYIIKEKKCFRPKKKLKKKHEKKNEKN